MRFRRLGDHFLVWGENPEEASRVEAFLVEFGESQAPPPVEDPPPPPPPVEVALEDIVYRVDVDKPFSEHSGYTLQCINTYTSANKIPERGIHGPKLPGGSTMRFGKVEVGGKQGLTFVLDPSDPKTSGNRRTELRMPDVKPEGVYWVAFNLFVPNWRQVPSGDDCVVGFQLHSGGSTGLSPAVALHARGGKTLEFSARYSLAVPADRNRSTSPKLVPFPLIYDTWQSVVVRLKYGIPDGGSLDAWVDGKQRVNYGGPLGYKHQYPPYFKFGFYNWTSGLNGTRAVVLRNPIVLLDPTGSKYSFSMIEALNRR